jgi:integrase/recombinase XerC
MQTVSHYGIRSFIDYLKFEKRYSVHTITAYHDDLTQFFLFLQKQFGEINLRKITHHFVRSWLAALKEQDISTRTINRKISVLKSFFKFHLRNGTVTHTPMAKVTAPKISRRLPVFIKETDTGKLMAALQLNTEDWKSLNTKMLVVLFYNTGMRLSEAINLKESQVDFYKSQIKVLGKGNKERIIPISGITLEALQDYLRLKKKEFASPPADYSRDKKDSTVLVTEKGKKLYSRYAYNLVRKVLAACVKTLDKKSPHVLRHTFATHLMNNGASLNAVKELLGHSSLAATQVYTHNTIEKLKDVYKKAHPKA